MRRIINFFFDECKRIGLLFDKGISPEKNAFLASHSSGNCDLLLPRRLSDRLDGDYLITLVADDLNLEYPQDAIVRLSAFVQTQDLMISLGYHPREDPICESPEVLVEIDGKKIFSNPVVKRNYLGSFRGYKELFSVARDVHTVGDFASGYKSKLFEGVGRK